MVKVDPGEHTLNGFVLLFYDSLYFGLRVKKVGDYFETVGLVEINPCGLSWRTVATEVSLRFPGSASLCGECQYGMFVENGTSRSHMIVNYRLPGPGFMVTCH